MAEFAFVPNEYSVEEADTDVEITIQLLSGELTFDIGVTVETTNTGTATGKLTSITFQPG